MSRSIPPTTARGRLRSTGGLAVLLLALVSATSGADSTRLAQSESIDGPEISRSRGEPGGIVLFWPRIIPLEARDQTHPMAAAIQSRLRTLIEESLPGRPIDVRPEPERVCPQAGCHAMTVGVLVLRQGEACVAVALLSRPGTSPTHLVPWAGMVELARTDVPFREPPEEQVTVMDFARCESLLSQMDQNAPGVADAIRAFGGSTTAD